MRVGMCNSNFSEHYENILKKRDDLSFLGWESKYKNNKSKARVICTNGHEWVASANNLANGSGCPKCSGCYCHTQEEQEMRFRDEFNLIFLNWLENYNNSNSNAVVMCAESHEFTCSINQLRKGKKCPECQGSYKNSEKEVIEKINNTVVFSFINWSDKYRGVMSNADVMCNNGHRTSVRLTNILAGHSCNKCSNGWIDSETREKELNSLKGRKFVRWEGDYKNCFSKAVMSCESGHEWSSPVMQLIKDTGYCPICSPHGFNPTLDGVLYVLRSSDGTMMKIGISNSPKNRFLKLRRSTPFKFRCVEKWISDGYSVMKKEKELLGEYEKIKFNLPFDGYTEWRVWDESIIEKIRLLQGDTQ